MKSLLQLLRLPSYVSVIVPYRKNMSIYRVYSQKGNHYMLKWLGNFNEGLDLISLGDSDVKMSNLTVDEFKEIPLDLIPDKIKNMP